MKSNLPKNSSDSFIWKFILNGQTFQLPLTLIFEIQKTHSIYVFLKVYLLICQALTCFQTVDWLVQYVSGSCLIFTSLFILKYSDLLKWTGAQAATCTSFLTKSVIQHTVNCKTKCD